MRIVIEKPFGTESGLGARAESRRAVGVFHESQIYRIDHYLGKETVQNILAFRLANGIFEPIWNRNYIDHVQLTVAETFGVDRRGGYYDEIGAFRDVVENHMLQLLAIVAMEPPVAFEAEPVRDEKLKVLRGAAPHPARAGGRVHAARPVHGRRAWTGSRWRAIAARRRSRRTRGPRRS